MFARYKFLISMISLTGTWLSNQQKSANHDCPLYLKAYPLL